jgi:hypothetical protein
MVLFGLANLNEVLILGELLPMKGALGRVQQHGLVWLGWLIWTSFSLRELLPEEGGLSRVQQHGLIWFD